MLIKESKLRQIIKSVIREAYDSPYGNRVNAGPGYYERPSKNLTSYNYDKNLYGMRNNDQGQTSYDPNDVGRYEAQKNLTSFDVASMSSGLCVKDISNRKNTDQKTFSVTLGLDAEGQSQKMIRRNRFDIDEQVDCPELTCQEASNMMGIPNTICQTIEDYLINPTSPNASDSVNVDVFEDENTVIVSFGGFFAKSRKKYSLSTGEEI